MTKNWEKTSAENEWENSAEGSTDCFPRKRINTPAPEVRRQWLKP